jgi:hypothetical protein
MERCENDKMRPYLSVSCSSKTFRLVWSRMVRALTKQPRSSFLARNMDMMGSGADRAQWARVGDIEISGIWRKFDDAGSGGI